MSEAAKKGLPERVKMRHSSHFVDELVTRSEQPVGKMVQLDAIEPDPDQPRVDFGNIDELAQSIRAKGVLEPILVRPWAESGESGGGVRYRIISGERRYRAARQAGIPEVPVVEMAVDDDEALEIALIENLQRKDLDAFEEAEGLNGLRERFEYTHEQIAGTMGKSRSVITETLTLLRIPEPLRRFAREHDLTAKSLLLEVAKLDNAEAMGALLQQAASGSLTRDDVREQTRAHGQRLARGGEAGRSGTRRPTFRFADPDASFKIALTFDREAVERRDVIQALERVLDDLRTAERADEEEDTDKPDMLF